MDCINCSKVSRCKMLSDYAISSNRACFKDSDKLDDIDCGEFEPIELKASKKAMFKNARKWRNDESC